MNTLHFAHISSISLFLFFSCKYSMLYTDYEKVHSFLSEALS